MRPAKWGSVLSLHSSNPEPLMSALGYKRTFSEVCAMSAFPPKKRTSAERMGMSVMGQLQTFRPHRASNRLDGSRSESGKPARHIGAIAFILGSEALPERRFFDHHHPDMKKKPE